MRKSAMLVMVGVAGVCSAQTDLTRAYEAELFADAAERTSLLAGGTGHDGKGFLLTDGGANRLYVGGNAQFRYIANWRSNTTSPDSGFTNGFTFRRVRLSASGTVLDPKLSFNLQMDFLTGESATLFEMVGEYKLSDTLTLRWGQFKLPYWQEETNSFLRLQAVERSTVNTVFTQNYSQAAMLRWAGESVRLYGAFSDGLNTVNTPYAAAGTDADWGVTGRAEWKWAGDWKQLDQFTSWRGAEYAGFLGAAVHAQDGGQTAAPSSSAGATQDATVFGYTADLSIKGNGWNAYLAGIGRHTDDDTANREYDDFGLLASAGLFVTDNVELFARYAAVLADDDRARGDTWNEWTVGFNNYLVRESQAAKFTLDLTYMPDDQFGSSALVKPSVNGTHILSSNGEDQVMIRAQMQIVF